MQCKILFFFLQAEKPLDDINILLVGKTGMGKSCVGNTILTCTSKSEFVADIFKTDGCSNSLTSRVEKDSKYVLNRKVTVVDTPGVIDTEKDKDAVLEEIATAVQKCPEGFDAFGLVMRYVHQIYYILLS